MSFVVKAEKALDSNKPPNYWTVNETEVILQNRSARSQNTENYYHISPDKTVRSGDDTLPLEAAAPDSVPLSDSEDNILKKIEWTESDDFVLYSSPTQNRPVETKTATQSFDLSNTPAAAGTLQHLQTVYLDKPTHLPTPTTVVSGTTAVPSTTSVQVIPSAPIIHEAPPLTGLHTVTTSTHVPHYLSPPLNVLPAGDPSPAVADAEHLED